MEYRERTREREKKMYFKQERRLARIEIWYLVCAAIREIEIAVRWHGETARLIACRDGHWLLPAVIDELNWQ